jgi:F-type H+-transporting ATPase subunit epsilon
MGTARVLMEDGTERTAACIGGMCSMLENECHLLPTTWEWSEDIDIERAEAARDRAEQQLREAAALSEEARIRTESKLYRALVRIGSAKQ